MSLILELTGFAFTLCGWVIIGATLSNSYWKVSSIHGSVITTSTLYENLWHSCAEDSIGVSNCRKFDTLLALPAYIQVCRALMITSLTLGVCGTLLTLLGLKSTLLGPSSQSTKTKIAMTGGVIFILGGLSSMVAVSWYAARITAQFFDSFYGGTKYELGYALYLGWAGSLLSIFGGGFLTCSAYNQQDRDQYDYSASERRIYTKPSEIVTSAKDYV
ncbi:hypothetical protein JRQ81_018089 [Phrynocephalus forsythii]|uniref:Claudin n=1 Tax=Phrynocephalus forsythii TaxID=171643 RepID=A0A9Q0XS49_9SAUR|nr:hypothetical protein JRQ81_018089 [Phrynocephalus forsythii]